MCSSELHILDRSDKGKKEEETFACAESSE
jgi:hypothetical protein